ncbi:MAG: hypothetical protein H5T61_10235 [Thermoflexales bacterium]|nr:hypothetical protein [Thermoflexales bacterium]
MKRDVHFWIFLALALVALLLAVWVAPGWGMPDQNTVRQTVPTRTPTPVLTPEAYLPAVLRNFSGQ